MEPYLAFQVAQFLVGFKQGRAWPMEYFGAAWDLATSPDNNMALQMLHQLVEQPGVMTL